MTSRVFGPHLRSDLSFAVPLAMALLLVPLASGVGGGRASAEDVAVAETSLGQNDLDAAVDAKLAANSLDDFETVLDHLRRALKKGLDEKSRQFADDLYTGTLVDRAGMVTEAIFSRPPDPQWQRMRTFALRDLGEVVDRDSELAPAQLMIARLESLPQGNRQRALTAAEKVIQIGGDDALQLAQAHVVLGQMANDDPERRGVEFDKAVELAPRDEEVLRTRSMHRLASNDIDGALTDLDAAIEGDPEDVELLETKGMALMVAQRPEEALETFDKAIGIDPESVVALVQRSRLFASRREWPRALADLDRAIEVDDDNPVPRVIRAEVHHRAGDKEQSIKDLKHVLSRDPNQTSAIELRGMIAAEEKEYPAAIADFRRLLRLEPDNPQVIAQLGIFYLADKQPREAIRRFTRALEIDPEQFFSRRGRGDAEIAIGDHAAAIADLEKALELEPENSAVLNNLAWVLATSPDDGVRDGARAISIALKACEQTQWEQPHIISTLAAAYAESGNFDEARRYSRQAVEAADAESEVRGQLQSELASYDAQMPWRERQEVVEQGARGSRPAAGSQETSEEPEGKKAGEPQSVPSPSEPPAKPRSRRPFD